MRGIAALLAILVALIPLAGCDDEDAEPGASKEATLVLDFQPNAVHAGLYTALRRGYFDDAEVELEIREPSASTDAPKLLEAGRAQFAILDVHDLGIARERGFDVVGVAAIVQRPLAAVIAADRDAVRRPSDLEGGRVGVTGLPSDEAVLDSVIEADGADPRAVDRVTIGFQAVPALAAGELDAATAFWNAEGVTLRRQGVRTREFRVDDYGAPRYPELVLATSAQTLEGDPGLVRGVVRAAINGYRDTVARPGASLDDLLAENPGLDRAEQAAQMRALMSAHAFEPVGRVSARSVSAWLEWDRRHGILEGPIGRPFRSPLAPPR
jgi:putative hydroxymethylpyrimidine transport system substrate-binding protein